MRLEFPLSHDRNIFLYYLYSALYGLYPINAIVSLFFIAKGLGFVEIGIVVAVFQITGILFEIPTGYIADKFGRKISVVSGLILLVLTTAAWTFATNYIHFSILAAIWMLGFACISGSFEAYIYDYLKNKSLQNQYDKIISRATSIGFFIGAIGSIAGAWLFSIKGEFPYYLQIITFSLSLIAVLFMTTDKVIKSKDETKKQISLLSGFSKIKNSPQLLWFTVFISGFYAFYMYFLNSINSPYLLSLNVFDVKFLGLFFAGMAVYQAFLSDRFAKLKETLSDTMLLTVLMLVQVIALLGLSYFFGILGIFAYILFVTIEPFQSLLINSFAQKYADSESRATTISTIKMGNSVFAALIGIFAGVLFDNTGLQKGFLIVAFCLFVFSLSLLVFKKAKQIIL